MKERVDIFRVKRTHVKVRYQSTNGESLPDVSLGIERNRFGKLLNRELLSIAVEKETTFHVRSYSFYSFIDIDR